MPHRATAVLPKRSIPSHDREKPALDVHPLVAEVASLPAGEVYTRLRSRPEGLSEAEAAARLIAEGPNVLQRDGHVGVLRRFARALANPLVVLLSVLATVSLTTGDGRAAVVMMMMILLGVGLRLTQEVRAEAATAQLKALISVSATVVRGGVVQDIRIAQLVPGDVVHLAAGDMLPGDIRFVQAKDLFVVQGTLTGESFPVEKSEHPPEGPLSAPLALSNIGFLGTSVQSGTATGVVVATGERTYLGSVAEALREPAAPTSFDRGIARLTWLLIGITGIMVPLVFLINGLTKGRWGDAFFFAIAVAVGLTPEMLPMIVTVCLGRGAMVMGRKKVIVKRLNAIQNLGAMDVLCADKTGTLTMDRVLLERHCDVMLRESDEVLALAYTNSHFQTGLRSVLDRAILAHRDTKPCLFVPQLEKLDEIPFDFQRRIMSVVVRTADGQDRVITKGAPEALFSRCENFELNGVLHPMDHEHMIAVREEYDRLSAEGFRVLAVARKDVAARPPAAPGSTPYGKSDETGLTLLGYVAFLDPPKESACEAIAALSAHGIAVKVLTGDNDLVARKVCRDVGLATEHVLLGADVERFSSTELEEAVARTTLFARLEPVHKQRVIQALQRRGHTVGFMGDGINDAPALHAADVGISVDSAVDIAKESADIILLEKSLLVLDEGVVEGRRVFANIIKYVRMGASSNFGNMFSVLGASVFLPYLPMRPIQILANNMLYDIGQTVIPTDEVDNEQLEKPKPWDLTQLAHFILLVGPCSSLFDYTTFFMMLRLFGCADVSTPEAAAHSERLFQTGWFVESLLTQTVIIHIIRTNRVPFLQSRASMPLVLVGLAVMAMGIALPYSPLADALGFTPLPARYWPLLGLTLLSYAALTHGVKTMLLRRRWIS